MWKRVRVYGRVLNALLGFFYDFKRYVRFSAWKADMQDDDLRNYHMAKIYHSLEKSLSFTERRKDSGWGNAYLVLELVQIAERKKRYGYHDRAGLRVLKDFINHPDNYDCQRAKDIREQIGNLVWESNDVHGAITFNRNDFGKGKLQDPEGFFLSRYSLREFDEKAVALEDVERAIALAMKTPSVCNRQAWHVYHTAKPSVIKGALSHQHGNRGFGDSVPNLIIITVDLKAFMPGQEHYQHWIDGGLFSMSLIHAFHSLGIASCCLNWSQSPRNDQKMRSEFKVEPHHTIIMMLAFGYPANKNTVCASKRRPLKEIYSELKPKHKVVNEDRAANNP